MTMWLRDSNTHVNPVKKMVCANAICSKERPTSDMKVCLDKSQEPRYVCSNDCMTEFYRDMFCL